MILASIEKNGYYAKKDGVYFEFTWTHDNRFIIHRQMRSTEENPNDYEIVEVIDGIEQGEFTKVQVTVPESPYSTKRYYRGKVVVCGDNYEYKITTEQDDMEPEKITKLTWFGDCQPHSISPKQLEDLENTIKFNFNSQLHGSSK